MCISVRCGGCGQQVPPHTGLHPPPPGTVYMDFVGVWPTCPSSHRPSPASTRYTGTVYLDFVGGVANRSLLTQVLTRLHQVQYTSIPGLCGGCDQQVPSYTGRYLPQPGTHTIYCTWRQADEEEKIGNYFFIGKILSCIIYWLLRKYLEISIKSWTSKSKYMNQESLDQHQIKKNIKRNEKWKSRI